MLKDAVIVDIYFFNVHSIHTPWRRGGRRKEQRVKLS